VRILLILLYKPQSVVKQDFACSLLSEKVGGKKNRYRIFTIKKQTNKQTHTHTHTRNILPRDTHHMV